MQVIVNNINEIIRKEFSPMEMNPSKIDFPLYETDIDTLNDFLRSTAIYDTFDMNDSKFEILYNLAIDLRYVETKSKRDQFLNYIIPFYIKIWLLNISNSINKQKIDNIISEFNSSLKKNQENIVSIIGTNNFKRILNVYQKGLLHMLTSSINFYWHSIFNTIISFDGNALNSIWDSIINHSSQGYCAKNLIHFFSVLFFKKNQNPLGELIFPLYDDSFLWDYYSFENDLFNWDSKASQHFTNLLEADSVKKIIFELKKIIVDPYYHMVIEEICITDNCIYEIRRNEYLDKLNQKSAYKYWSQYGNN